MTGGRSRWRQWRVVLAADGGRVGWPVKATEVRTLDLSSLVVMDGNPQERIQAIFDDVDAIVPVWRATRRNYDHAVQHQGRGVRTAERILMSALGNLGLQRWRNLLSARAQINTTRDGLDMIRARRIRADVEAALAHLADVETSEAEHVAVALHELEAVAARLVPFGHLAVVVSGCPMDQLQRMATDGSRSLKNTRSGSASPSVSWIPIR